MIEEKIAKKLGIDIRSCKFICLDKELCHRILNETPISINEAVKKYHISESTIKRYIRNGLLSVFQNKEAKGSKMFIFENELTELVGKEIYPRNGLSSAYIVNETNKFYMTILRPILTYKEYNIIKSIILDKKPTSVICEEQDLSRERVRQILRKGMFKVKRYVSMYPEYETLKEELSLLREEKRKITNYLLGVKNENSKELELFTKQQELFNTKITSLQMSVRAYNVLYSGNIETIGDLVSYNRSDMLKFRNLGKKVLMELEQLLDEHGLHFGMFKNLQK